MCNICARTTIDLYISEEGDFAEWASCLKHQIIMRFVKQ